MAIFSQCSKDYFRNSLYKLERQCANGELLQVRNMQNMCTLSGAPGDVTSWSRDGLLYFRMGVLMCLFGI